jgi:long-chain acyl-CoA synthetase
MRSAATLDHQVTTDRQKVVFTTDKGIWTNRLLTSEVDRLASGFVEHGIQPGDRIALHMANLPELVVAYQACFKIGAIAAPLNIRFKTAELEPLLQRLRPSLYMGQASVYDRVASVDSSILPADRRFLVDGPVTDRRARPWTGLLAGTRGITDQPPLDVDAPAVLLTTSGTTGRPKFVIHTLATLAAIADSLGHWDLHRGQVAALACPMMHASGLFTVLACIHLGVPFVLVERFDPDVVLDAIERRKCTWLAGLPFMFAALLKHQRSRPRNVESLRTCLAGGDVCPPQLREEFSACFRVPLRTVWASTETCGSLTYGLQPGPVNRAVYGMQVRLVDDHHVPVPPSEVGELVLRGPNVSIGYWAGPGVIEDAPEDGWFHTGDLMRQDKNGDLWFVSRKKHLIIRGGSNISPIEVEQVLVSHPAVRDAAVVGVPDTELGQRVAGFVQLANGMTQTVTPNEIQAHVSQRLADYKVPESLTIVPEIPRNALGKIDRNLLLTMLSDQSAKP